VKSGLTSKNDIRHKTYIPLTGKEVSAPPLHDDAGTDPFVPPIQRVIRQIVGREHGGDSASAQIAAVNRRSRVIRDIIRTLLESSDPLVLLGDPGTGKTMTLQQAALRLFDSEIKRVFPVVTLYVRLGEFYVAGPVTPDHVWKYVKASVSPKISPDLQRRVCVVDGRRHRPVAKVQPWRALDVHSRNQWRKSRFDAAYLELDIWSRGPNRIPNRRLRGRLCRSWVNRNSDCSRNSFFGFDELSGCHGACEAF
jgi:hypothetical protein